MLGWYLAEEAVPQENIHSLWVSDHAAPGTLINVESAFFLSSDELRSPMSMNVAAFASERQRREAAARYGGDEVTYDDVVIFAEAYR